MIELAYVTKKYGNKMAVRRVSLEVDRGELLILLGESGCGKTTTLKMVNRLIEPTGGTIRINGVDNRDVEPHVLRRRIGYCFQGIGLFPHMTVAANIGITPKLLKWQPERIRDRVDELLDLVELPPEQYRGRYPKELSGGQKQRVGVARALAAKPEVMLFDEPFGALDPLTRDRLQQSVREIRKKLNLTSIFVTHDMVEAILMGDRIAVMHEANLLQVGTARELLRTPANDYVEQLMTTPARQAHAVEELVGTH